MLSKAKNAAHTIMNEYHLPWDENPSWAVLFRQFCHHGDVRMENRGHLVRSSREGTDLANASAKENI